MTMYFEAAFWLSAAAVLYVYVGYPLALLLLAHLRPRVVLRDGAGRSVSVVMAAFNESSSIGRRVNEFLEVLSRPGVEGELILVSDGSSDDTEHAARRAATDFPEADFRFISLPAKSGKAVALSTGCAAAKKQVLIFADVRQTWERDAVTRLLENFADPDVGAVSGELVVGAEGGVMKAVGFYWRYEKWIRKNESRFWSTTGATGAISAVRRELFCPIPRGTILDDVYWPLNVVRQGFRVIHDERAVAFDQLPKSARDEFLRKVRTLSGNFQLVAHSPWTLLPGKNPVWFQFVSHKLLRLAVPWLLLVLLAISAILAGHFYGTLFWLQIVAYAFGLMGMSRRFGTRSRVIGIAASFLVLNAAAWIAFWKWIFGQSGQTWGKVIYKPVNVSPLNQRLRHDPDHSRNQA